MCDKSDEPVKCFRIETLTKCTLSSASRIHFHLKYKNCEVPTEIDASVGYHRNCYSALNALKPQHRLSTKPNTCVK